MAEHLYNSLNSFLREKFGGKAYKVSIDAGFKCPNLDGSISGRGCIFCNNESISPKGFDRTLSPVEQLTEGMEYIRKRHGASKFIAYLQPYSNTYADVEKLKEIYEPLFEKRDVVAMAISTRPDCLSGETLDYLAVLMKRKYLWLEIGLQSSHNSTLERINRGHSYGDFLRAFEGAKRRGIPVCVHAILGLPGETREMMFSTVEKLSSLGIFGLKIHALHVNRDTELCRMYTDGEITLMPLKEYVETVADCLEIADPNIVIHRLTGEGPRGITVAPEWIFNKLAVVDAIKNELKRRGTHQGSRFRL